ncbi:MAG TPA: poly(3-hydroxyalkanoate) depolymerase [Mycobacterium sp.]|nr:poly(3-hydroxyalkanoate) depolymerase [Mycobacterium sp.]
MSRTPCSDDVFGHEPVARALEIRQVHVAGMTVRTLVWPSSTPGIPLLIFNGIGARAEMLAPFADALPDIEVITFDVPGTGESSPALVPYRLWMLSILASQLLTRLGYTQVDTLGVSWGGAIAQQFAVQNPRRCRRLILAATSPGFVMVPPKWSVLTKFLTPRRYNDPEFRRAIAGQIYGGRARSNPQLIDEFQRTSWLGYLLQQVAITGWSSLPWLRLLRQPTLILAGNDDPVITLPNARLMAHMIPDAQLRVLDDGHLFIIFSAAETAAQVQEFLSHKPARKGAK